MNCENWVATLPPASLMFAKLSPTARHVAYVRENNLYVEDLASRQITALTASADRHIINGTFDWVYEEELSLRDGFAWSPDGTAIAYWQLDTTGVPEFTLVNNTDGLYPKLTTFAYPKVGQQNSACRVGVVPATGGETRWLDVPGDPRDHYIARLAWTPGLAARVAAAAESPTERQPRPAGRRAIRASRRRPDRTR